MKGLWDLKFIVAHLLWEEPYLIIVRAALDTWQNYGRLNLIEPFMLDDSTFSSVVVQLKFWRASS